MEEGEARLMVGDAEQVVRPGSVIDVGVVKSVAPGRLVLWRAASAEDKRGEALLIVTFGPDGEARVRTIWKDDRSAPARGEGR
jgi:hypothetical protein